MAAFTGLRRGELSGLTGDRLDLLHGTVRVTEQRQQLKDGTLIVGPPKTDAGRRTVALPGPLIPELEAHLASYGPGYPNGLVFTGEKGGFATTSGRRRGPRLAPPWTYPTSISTTSATSPTP